MSATFEKDAISLCKELLLKYSEEKDIETSIKMNAMRNIASDWEGMVTLSGKKKSLLIKDYIDGMEKIMKHLKLMFVFTSLSVAQSLNDDLAYRMVAEKLGDAIPDAFVREAFTHDELKIHKEIADRFARPYEKKTWGEYRKLFVKESRIAAGAKFYKQNKKLITTVAKEYKVDPFIIVTIAGIESNYGSHHSQFSVFNALYTQIHEMPRRSNWASKELAEFLKYCFNDQLDPQEIGGS